MILLISNKESYASQRLLEELQNAGCKAVAFSVNELFESKNKLDIRKFSVLYVRNVFCNQSPQYLPQVVELAKSFIKDGKKVVDENIAVGFLALGKWEDYKKLKAAGILMPETRVILDDAIFENLNKTPWVLKWVYGMKARHVYLVHDLAQLKKIYAKYPKGELLLQQYIPADYEYKVITVGYKALPKVIRFDISSACGQNKFKIDYKSGKALDAKDINPHIIELAEKAAAVLGRELSKVDILERQGQCFVLEVNRNPGFSSFEKISKFNVAKEFVRYLQK
ncbi:MAG: ATP-grasp domain-containing protein [Candidatus Doudnabacteria bacterium]|nr:ATP-grasp domain-containing protein [Candidatus Doudnabacteria bacterium]